MKKATVQGGRPSSTDRLRLATMTSCIQSVGEQNTVHGAGQKQSISVCQVSVSANLIDTVEVFRFGTSASCCFTLTPLTSLIVYYYAVVSVSSNQRHSQPESSSALIGCLRMLPSTAVQ